MPGVHFEQKIRRIIEDHLKDNGIKAVSKRNVMTRWSAQTIDLEVDSANPQWYMGIECKSTTTKKTPITFYYSTVFSKGQFDHLLDFFDNSGRRGFLAIEVGFNKNRSNGEVSWPKKRKIFIVDWGEVVRVHESGSKSFKLLCPDPEDEIPYRLLKKTDEHEYNVEHAFQIVTK